MNLPDENKRLADIIKHYHNGNELAFSKDIGVSQPRINRLFSKDTRSGKYPLISFEILQATINKFIEISPEWLITGKGHMFKDAKAIDIGKVTGIRKLKTDRNSTLQRIPLYNIAASAGVFDIITEEHRQRSIPIDYIQIPNMPACDGAVPITGDSMYPLLKAGDIVLFKEVVDKSNIIWGEMYLAVIRHNGDSFFFSKYIQKSEKKGYARFVSENKHHQPVEFPLDSIEALAIIKASIRYQSSF